MMARITFSLVFVSLLVGGLFIATEPLEAQRVDPGGVLRESYGCGNITYTNDYTMTIGTVGYTPDWGDGSTPIEGNVGNRSMYDVATIGDTGEGCATTEDLGTPAPTASLGVSANSVQLGSSATLTWSSTNATSCTGTGFSTGGATSGSVSVSPSVQTIYALTCVSGTQQAVDSETITVTYPPVSQPWVALNASPLSIDKGRSTQLTWSSLNATSCTGSGFSTGGATSGSVVTTPGATTDYVITCRNTVSGTETTTTPGTTVTTVTDNTWHLEGIVDVSDFYGSVTDPNRAYNNVANCPSNPAGRVCSPGGSICKINEVSGNSIETTLYSCEGRQTVVTTNGGTTTTTPRTEELVALASVTVVVVPRANLTVSGLAPSGATVGVATTLSATISNVGDIAAAGFSTRFQAKPQSEVASTNLQSGNMSLNAGASGVASVGYTFASPGAHQIRACADMPANAIPEYNENDNCTAWATVVVIPNPPEPPVPPVQPPVQPPVVDPPVQPPVQPPVNPNPPTQQPIAGISVDPTSIEDGDTATLTWSCTGSSTSALGSGFSTSGRLSGSLSVSPSQTITYTVVCRNGSDSATASTILTVLTAAFDMTFTGSPLLVRAGGQSTLTWTLGRGPTCTLGGPGLQRSNIRTSGSQVVTVTETSTYSLSCRKGQSAETRNVTIRIIPSIGEF